MFAVELMFWLVILCGVVGLLMIFAGTAEIVDRVRIYRAIRGKARRTASTPCVLCHTPLGAKDAELANFHPFECP